MTKQRHRPKVRSHKHTKAIGRVEMTKIKTETEFAYWLQGFFEISGTDQLTVDQAKIILEAAKTLPANQQKLAQKITDTIIQNGAANAGPELAEILNDMFEHHIDPSYAGNQNQFNSIHNNGKGPNKPGVRC